MRSEKEIRELLGEVIIRSDEARKILGLAPGIQLYSAERALKWVLEEL
jgi:hypothetical protein